MVASAFAYDRAVPTAEDRILDAAESVFSQQGYRGGALNDVAVAAGYTRAGLLHYYPNKASLLLALLERRDARLHVFDVGRSGSSLTEFYERIDLQLGDLLRLRTLIQLGHIVTAEATTPDHPAYEWVHQRELRLRSQLESAARVSQERGELDPRLDPASVALLVLGSFEGLETQWLLDEDVDLQAGVAVVRSLLLPGDPRPARA
jgi:AcrR family transcriptional regulator